MISLFPLIVLTQWTECNNPLLIGNGICDEDYEYSGLCNYGGGDCCDQSRIGNGACEKYNNFASCGNFDGGDCPNFDYIFKLLGQFPIIQ